MVDQLDQIDGPIDLLEYTTTNVESFVAFNKEGDKGVHEGDRVVEKGVEGGHFNEAPTTTIYVKLENEAAPNKASSTGFVTAGGEAATGGKVAATAEAAPGEASSAGVVAAGGEAAAGGKVATTSEDSVGSSILNVGPSDVPSTSRPRGDQETLPITTDAPPRPRGRPRKISDNPDAPPRPRGRPRKTIPAAPTGQAAPAANATARGRERSVEYTTAAARGRERGVEHVEHVTATARERGRSVKHAEIAAKGREKGVKHAAAVARGRERGVEHVAGATVSRRGRGRLRKITLGDIGVARRTPLHEWFENQTSYAPPNPPALPIYAPPNPFASPVHTPPNPHALTGKRPKTVGMGVLIAENGFTIYNPGLPSSRILHTGSAHPIRSADITEDLGYKPKTGVTWKGKKIMTEN
ncbi:hypothetical protein FXO38_25650 [Capsicum annuum]|nr:hypothetical protein FXO38_25650 [Capsicum annuum]